MPHDPIPYDPTNLALVRPETRPPIDDFSTDWELDPICAELARLAYIRFDEGHEADLVAAMAKAGFTPPRCFGRKATGAQAFGTTIAGRTVFVSFRGTQADKWRDVVADIEFIPCEWGGPGLVHSGFWEAYASLRDEIGKWLEEQPETSLVITGHSLGAAMATLMAAHHPRAQLVTFGSPRVGTTPFAAQFAGRDVRRYVDCADFVTRVPLPRLLDCTHLEGETYIDSGVGLHRPPPDDSAIRSDRWSAGLAYLARYGWRFWENVPVRLGADHAPINYVSAVLGRRGAA
jgi:pimeloyl-ACP methyl ester carboxylesterase